MSAWRLRPGAYDVVAFATASRSAGDRENWYVLRRRGGERRAAERLTRVSIDESLSTAPRCSFARRSRPLLGPMRRSLGPSS